MAMQTKVWMTTVLFDEWIFHFIAFIQNFKGNISPTNHHLFILTTIIHMLL
jgi:hypothetical protein